MLENNEIAERLYPYSNLAGGNHDDPNAQRILSTQYIQWSRDTSSIYKNSFLYGFGSLFALTHLTQKAGLMNFHVLIKQNPARSAMFYFLGTFVGVVCNACAIKRSNPAFDNHDINQRVGDNMQAHDLTASIR